MTCELLHGGGPSSGVVLTVLFVLVALVYLRGCVRLLRHPRRAIAFLAGLVVAWAVIASPLAALDHQLLIFHMLQHLLLMTVAAPLLLIGISPRRALMHPVVCWLAGTAVVIAWHVPAAHALSMRSQAMHLAQHVTFLAAGILFWWPVIQRRSASWISLYLFLATLPCDALSAFLAFCGRPLYPSHGAAAFGMTALRDQECAGALMWFWVTFAYLLPAAAVTLRMLAPARPDPGLIPMEVSR